jgi:hypothetical protein
LVFFFFFFFFLEGMNWLRPQQNNDKIRYRGT